MDDRLRHLALVALAASTLACATVIGTPTPPASIEGVVTFAVDSAQHFTTDIEYDRLPPAGGSHDPIWLNCGLYDEPVRQEHAVHSQEHGAVWITYRLDLPAAGVEQLRRVVRGRDYVIVSPYPDQEEAVVASAWGVQLRVEEAGDERIEQFILKYAQGPQTPEPGAPCDNGTGTPIE